MMIDKGIDWISAVPHPIPMFITKSVASAPSSAMMRSTITRFRIVIPAQPERCFHSKRRWYAASSKIASFIPIGLHSDACPCCPKAQRGRWIFRYEDEAVVEAFIRRMDTDEVKQIYRTRSATAEFIHVWIKEKFGVRCFRLRGLAKVGFEAMWACLTYDIQQWLRLRWKPRLQQIVA